MRITIGKITNAWVVALELEEGVREYAYPTNKDALEHVKRLMQSVDKNTEENL